MKILLALVTAFGLSSSALAQAGVQPIEVTPFAGYLFGGKLLSSPPIPFVGFDQIAVADHFDFGVRLGFNASSTIEPEIQWTRTNTALMLEPVPGQPNLLKPSLTIDYLLAGASYNFLSGNIRPYVSLSLGAARISEVGQLNLVGYQLMPATNFAVSAGVGVKMFMTPNLGFRFEARGYGSETPGNFVAACSMGDVSRSCVKSWIMNGDLTGGLVIAF